MNFGKKLELRQRKLLIVDGLRHVVLLGLISNFFEGIAFAQLLQIPYLKLFSSLLGERNPLSLVTIFLLIYRIGRLVISSLDSKLPKYFHHNGFAIGMGSIGLGMVLVYASNYSNIYLIHSAAIFFGFGTTLSGLNLRELLTADEDLNKKRNFNMLSNVGWSIGVGASGLILVPELFKIELVMGVLLVVTLLFFSMQEEKAKIENTEYIDQNMTASSKKLKITNRDLLFLFSMSTLMTGMITNQINASIMGQITGIFQIAEGIQSLVLLIPILGSLIFLIPAVSLLFRRSFSFFEIGSLNLIYFGILILLFYSKSFLLFCILLATVGFLSNEIMTAIYQAVAIKQSAGLKRATHASIEVVTVFGAFLTWILNKFLFSIPMLNYGIILAVPLFILFFLSDVRILFSQSSKYDKGH
jgi:hypothetical protein